MKWTEPEPEDLLLLFILGLLGFRIEINDCEKKKKKILFIQKIFTIRK